MKTVYSNHLDAIHTEFILDISEVKSHMYSSSGATSKSNRHKSSLKGNIYVDVTLDVIE